MKNSRFLPPLLLALVLLQAAVVVGSWLLTAIMPQTSMHSLLSNGGIRWLFGTFVVNLSHPFLIWLILADIAVGSLKASGLWSSIRALCIKTGIDSQQKSGLQVALGILVVEIIIICLLTLPTRAILLSSTGHLFPSSFSVAIVPIIAIMAITAAIAYGLFSGQLHNYRNVFECVCHGTTTLKSLLVVYILGMELICSVAYVLG